MTRVFTPFGGRFVEAYPFTPHPTDRMRPFFHVPAQLKMIGQEGLLLEVSPSNPGIYEQPIPTCIINVENGVGTVVGQFDFEEFYRDLQRSGLMRGVQHPTKQMRAKHRRSPKGELMTSDVVAIPHRNDSRDVCFSVIIPGSGRILDITDTQLSPIDDQLGKVLMRDAQEKGIAIPVTHRRIGPEIVQLSLAHVDKPHFAPVVELIEANLTIDI